VCSQWPDRRLRDYQKVAGNTDPPNLKSIAADLNRGVCTVDACVAQLDEMWQSAENYHMSNRAFSNSVLAQLAIDHHTETLTWANSGTTLTKTKGATRNEGGDGGDGGAATTAITGDMESKNEKIEDEAKGAETEPVATPKKPKKPQKRKTLSSTKRKTFPSKKNKRARTSKSREATATATTAQIVDDPTEEATPEGSGPKEATSEKKASGEEETPEEEEEKEEDDEEEDKTPEEKVPKDKTFEEKSPDKAMSEGEEETSKKASETSEDVGADKEKDKLGLQSGDKTRSIAVSDTKDPSIQQAVGLLQTMSADTDTHALAKDSVATKKTTVAVVAAATTAIVNPKKKTKKTRKSTFSSKKQQKVSAKNKSIVTAPLNAVATEADVDEASAPIPEALDSIHDEDEDEDERQRSPIKATKPKSRPSSTRVVATVKEKPKTNPKTKTKAKTKPKTKTKSPKKASRIRRITNESPDAPVLSTTSKSSEAPTVVITARLSPPPPPEAPAVIRLSTAEATAKVQVLKQLVSHLSRDQLPTFMSHVRTHAPTAYTFNAGPPSPTHPTGRKFASVLLEALPICLLDSISAFVANLAAYATPNIVPQPITSPSTPSTSSFATSSAPLTPSLALHGSTLQTPIPITNVDAPPLLPTSAPISATPAVITTPTSTSVHTNSSSTTSTTIASLSNVNFPIPRRRLPLHQSRPSSPNQQ
jgi:hypothetical protein